MVLPTCQHTAARQAKAWHQYGLAHSRGAVAMWPVPEVLWAVVLLMLSYYCAGYGVFATRDFRKGEFLLEYCGKLIDTNSADKLEDQTYVYYFSIGSKTFRFVRNVI